MLSKIQRPDIGLSAFSAASLLLLTARAKKEGGPTNATPMLVSVVTVEQRDVPLYGNWVATLDGYVNAQIQPQVSGYLISRTIAKAQSYKAAKSTLKHSQTIQIITRRSSIWPSPRKMKDSPSCNCTARLEEAGKSNPGRVEHPYPKEGRL